MMINPLRFFANFFGLLVAASGVLGVLFVTFCGLAIIMALAESAHTPFWGAIYLSAVTALTIGYGDLHPDTPLGRTVAVALGLLGVVLVGVVVAAAIKALEQSDPSHRLNGGRHG